MQNPSGGPPPGGSNQQGPWNPTRQQLDQLESILQKMVNNPTPIETNPLPQPSQASNWTTPPFAQSASSSNRSPYQVPHNPFQNTQGNESTPSGASSVWNPSQTTWGPLADNWRNQQTGPLTQPVSINPEWNRPTLPPSTLPFQSTQLSINQSSRVKNSVDDDFGETGISWLINAGIDLPLRFLGSPGRFLITNGGRYFLAFFGFIFLTYSGILVASDWLEWPWADRLIPSNLVSSLMRKIG